MEPEKIIHSQKEPSASAEVATRKRPYEEPRIVYRAPLEAVAGVCSNNRIQVELCSVYNAKGAFPCTVITS